MFPTFFTAKDAIQVPITEASIKLASEDKDTDIDANNESPAPVTSTGLMDNAGKFCLPVGFKSLYAIKPFAPSLISIFFELVLFIKVLAIHSMPLSLSSNATLDSFSVGVIKSNPLNLETFPT